MATATVTSKGQITLPKIVRERLGVGAGDKVEFVETAPGTFRVVAATRDVRALKGLIPETGQARHRGGDEPGHREDGRWR
jgi:AbrB family looped-hinge helix DNA binding protein